MEPRVLEGLLEELTGLEQLSVWRDPADLERFSRDAYDYSPVLLERLRSCRADLVVRPESVAAVMAVAAACARHQVPLTLRGAGTGLSRGGW
jgi:FAD/FMN-containing dehydrogenase